MLDDSEFKPYSLTDFTVAETPAEEPDSSPSQEESDSLLLEEESENGAESEAESEEIKASIRLASFKPVTFNEEGEVSDSLADNSVEQDIIKSNAEKIRLSTDFKNTEFFQENSLLTNAEEFAESVIDGAKLYKTQLLVKIEEQLTDTKRIHQKTVAENKVAEEQRIELLSVAENEVKEIENKAFEDGFEAGRLQGLQQRYDEAGPLVSQVNSVLKQLNSLRQVVRFQAEEELVSLSLQIAKNVVAEEIKLNRDVIKNIVQTALHETDVQGKIFVYLHPDDYEFLLKSKVDLERYLSEEQTLLLRQNPDMEPGSIYVESDEEIISRSLDDQFEKLEKSLSEQVENRHAHLKEVEIEAYDFSSTPPSDVLTAQRETEGIEQQQNIEDNVTSIEDSQEITPQDTAAELNSDSTEADNSLNPKEDDSTKIEMSADTVKSVEQVDANEAENTGLDKELNEPNSEEQALETEKLTLQTDKS